MICRMNLNDFDMMKGHHPMIMPVSSTEKLKYNFPVGQTPVIYFFNSHSNCKQKLKNRASPVNFQKKKYLEIIYLCLPLWIMLS